MNTWLKRGLWLGLVIAVIAFVYYLPLFISLGRPKLVQAVPQWQPQLEAQAQDVATPSANQFVYPTLGISAPLANEPHVSPWDQAEWGVLRDDLTKGVAITYDADSLNQATAAQITGHSSGNYGAYSYIFASLGQAKLGDQFMVQVDGHIYTYTVVDKRTYLPTQVPDDRSLINGKQRVELLCCWPVGSTANRLMITGELSGVE